MLETVQITGEKLKGPKVKDVCDSLQHGNLAVLSLRECILADKDFKKILRAVGQSKSILQLSLNVDLVNDSVRIQALVQALQKNRSITSLFLHGNDIGDDGMKALCPALSKHPYIIRIDLSDCKLGDFSVELILPLLQARGGKPGLFELSLSDNPDITAKGWTKLSMAVAARNNLRALFLDYNPLGDRCASAFLVALASRKGIQTLDLEATGITEFTAQLVLHVIQTYPVGLKKINLDGNNISKGTLEAIKMYLNDLEESDGVRSSPTIGSEEEPSLATSEPPLHGNDSRRTSVDNVEHMELTRVPSEDLLVLTEALEADDGPLRNISPPGVTVVKCAETAEVLDDNDGGSSEELLSVHGNERLLMVPSTQSTSSLTGMRQGSLDGPFHVRPASQSVTSLTGSKGGALLVTPATRSMSSMPGPITKVKGSGVATPDTRSVSSVGFMKGNTDCRPGSALKPTPKLSMQHDEVANNMTAVDVERDKVDQNLELEELSDEDLMR